MKRILTMSALALGVAAVAVVAGQAQETRPGTGVEDVSWRGGNERGWRGGDERGWRDGQHGQRGENRFRRQGRQGPGPGAGPGGGRGGDLARQLEVFDLDKNGAITQAEVDQFRQGQITRFDANGDGTLSLEEYQALWLDQLRERMVDAFQGHDDDGNGQVTAEEFNENYTGLVERLDRNGDGQLNADDRGGRRQAAPRPQDGAAPPAPAATPAPGAAPAPPAPAAPR